MARRPRVLISALVGVQGGPRTYAVSLARELPRAAPDLEFVWLSEIRPPDLEGTGVRVETLALAHPVLRPLWDHLGVPLRLRDLGADLHHNTKNALPLARGGPSVVTIHDLAPFILPETFSPLSGLFLRFHIRHAARAATAVIAVSERTRGDLVEILGVPAEKIHTVPNGVRAAFGASPSARHAAVRTRYGLSGRYVLFAGTIQPRKNPDVVLEAFLDLPAGTREGLTLVFAGRRGWMARDFEEKLARVGEACAVRLLPGVPDADMPDLYAGALVFVSPSSYEGFGLTVLEAMAAGTPVVASNVSATPEVVGDDGLLVSPTDPAEVAEAMRRLLEDEPLRRRLGEAGRRRAKGFTWARCARETAAVYRKVLGLEAPGDRPPS